MRSTTGLGARAGLTVLFTALAGLLAVLLAPRADARCAPVYVNGAISTVCASGAVGGPGAGSDSGGSWPPTAPYNFMLEAGPDNCFYLRERTYDERPLDGWFWGYTTYTYLWNAALTGDATIPGSGVDYTGPCQWMIEDIGPVIQDAWQTTPLPAPRPVIAPGRALVGLESYLVLDSPRTFQHVATTSGALTIDIAIDVTATHDVTWGDDTATTDITGLGVAWPGGPGEITHTWQTAGTPTVTAEAEWSGSWDAGTWGSGTVNPTRTVPGSIDLPVQELQGIIIE